MTDLTPSHGNPNSQAGKPMTQPGPDGHLIPLCVLGMTPITTDQKIDLLANVLAEMGAIIARIADGQHPGAAMRRCDTIVWMPGGEVAIRARPG